jgi:hypothetical protein
MWIPSGPSKAARYSALAVLRSNVSAGSRESPGEIESPLQKNGLLHLVEKTRDQAKVDLIKAEIIEIYRDYGIAVGADSSLEPIRDLLAVRIFIEVYNQ